jgi:TatA/E family protein of Tat protein translocase
MGPLGIQEMVFIFVFALLIFGPKKLPELGRTFGKGMAEFRRASNELKSTFQREMDNIERETKMDEARKAASEAKKALTDATYYEDSEQDYYDAYDGGGVKTASKSSNHSSTGSESAPSTGGSTDSANPGVETPSNDSSSVGVQTAEARKPELDAGNEAETAATKGAA